MVKSKINTKNYIDARTAFYLHPSAPLENSTQYRVHSGAYSIPGGTVATSRKEFSGAAAGMSGGAINIPGGALKIPGGAVNIPGGAINIPGGALKIPGGALHIAGKPGRVSYKGRGANAAGSEVHPTDVLFSYEAGRLPDTKSTSIKRSKHMRPDINTGQQAFKTQIRRKGKMLIPPVLRKDKMAELASTMSGGALDAGTFVDGLNSFNEGVRGVANSFNSAMDGAASVDLSNSLRSVPGMIATEAAKELGPYALGSIGALGVYQLGKYAYNKYRERKKMRGGAFLDYLNQANAALSTANTAMEMAPQIVDKVSEGWEWIKKNPGKTALIGAAGIGAAVAPYASNYAQGLMKGRGKKKLRKHQKKRT